MHLVSHSMQKATGGLEDKLLDSKQKCTDPELASASTAKSERALLAPIAWDEWLPLPKPVFLALVVGALCGASLGLRTFFGSLIAACILAPPIYRICMRQLARKLKAYAEQEDRHVLGVDVHIGSIELSVCYGRVVFHNITLDNPEGFTSDYLLKAAKIVIDVDMLELIRTRGSRVVVEELSFDDVHAIIEYDSMFFGSAFGKSNLQKVKEMHSARQKAEPKTPENDGNTKQTSKPSREWILHKAAFTHVGAIFENRLNEVRVECADLRFKHLSDEVESQHLVDLLSHLLQTLTEHVHIHVAARH